MGRKIGLVIAYNGELFQGFQRQPHGNTIENSIEEVLLKHKVINQRFSPEIQYSAASRTDKGVHAIHQVISFNTDYNPDKVADIINNDLFPE